MKFVFTNSPVSHLVRNTNVCAHAHTHLCKHTEDVQENTFTNIFVYFYDRNNTLLLWCLLLPELTPEITNDSSLIMVPNRMSFDRSYYVMLKKSHKELPFNQNVKYLSIKTYFLKVKM